jgi:CBS domain containing-hemolysin-like protein
VNSQIDVLWIGLAVLLLLDMALAAARASLLNSRLPHLLTLQEQNPEQVERTLHLVENLRLRVALRLMAILLHGLVAVLGWLLFTAYTGLAASFWLVVGVVFAALLLLLTLEFIVEGRILPEAESWAVRLTWLGRLVEFILRPFSVLLLPLLGSPDRVQRRYSPVTEEELKTWVEAGPAEGSLEQGERKMIYSIFQFGDTLCREIMVPRMDLSLIHI